MKWPDDCILVTVRRGREVLFPHGDTLLEAGDVLVAVAEGDAREQLKQDCSTTNGKN